jgi:hypothetical protein
MDGKYQQNVGPSRNNQQQEKTQFRFENACCEKGRKQARRQTVRQASDWCALCDFCENVPGKSWRVPRRNATVGHMILCSPVWALSELKGSQYG